MKIEPKNGFQTLRKRIDSLNLLNLSSLIDLSELPLHQPFSMYVIEFKSHNEYNCFQFDTYFPYNGEVDGKYVAIEKLLFDEFAIPQYYKFSK
jgi:hypothetical protein